MNSSKSKSKSGESKDSSNQEKISWYDRNKSKIAAWNIFVTATFTLTLIILNYCSNKTNDKTLDLMREEFYANYRPYLSVQAHNYTMVKDSIGMTFQYMNNGNVSCDFSDSVWAFYDNEWQYWDHADDNQKLAIIPGEIRYSFFTLASHNGTEIQSLDSMRVKVSYYSSLNDSNYINDVLFVHKEKKLLLVNQFAN